MVVVLDALGDLFFVIDFGRNVSITAVRITGRCNYSAIQEILLSRFVNTDIYEENVRSVSLNNMVFLLTSPLLS